MSDFEQDERIGGLLLMAGQEVASYVRPAGPEAVYGTVRRRRRNRLIVAGVAGVALVVGPIAGLSMLPDPHHAAPSIAVQPSGVTSPDPVPSASASTAASTAAPNAAATRISADTLNNATLEIPVWPVGLSEDCPHGPVRFSQGKAAMSGRPPLDIVGQPAYADVDHNGTDETAFVVRCSPQGEDDKVLVVGRTATGGIRSVGQVVASAGSSGKEKVDIMRIWAVQAADNGQLRVDVGEYRPCCGTPQDLPQHQWRTYGWAAGKFSQTSGPRTFGANPNITDLQVSAGNVAMAKQPDGSWKGSFTVTVRNAGPYDAKAWINLTGQAKITASAANWAGCKDLPDPSDPMITTGCDLGTLAAGSSRTLTLPFTTTTAQTSKLTFATTHYFDGELEYPDSNQANNVTEVTVTAN